MNYFNDHGRCIPSSGMRVFAENPSYYYAIKQPCIDYQAIYQRLKDYGGVSKLSLEEFEYKASSLLHEINSDSNYTNITKGVGLPFILEPSEGELDFGENLEEILLPKLKDSFLAEHSELHFKAILQGDSRLKQLVLIEPRSRYARLLDAARKGPVVGWYFPQALQEFDVESQRAQIQHLPELKNSDFCLSGGLDICMALTGYPGLLINEDSYAPILCMSAYTHKDPRLVMLLKSYGPHLEFWCMTQMLAKDITQLSEQWTGGISIFTR